MFLDYYAILEVDAQASQQEVKESFRRQALKWHPDRNFGQDTTVIMQQINEAYLIIKDKEARERYDKEYYRFMCCQKKRNNSNQERSVAQTENCNNINSEDNTHERQYSYSDYVVNDDILRRWMENARKQAVELAINTLEDFREISGAGIKAISKEALAGLGSYVVVGVIMAMIFQVIASCGVR